ncbi:restriction endonuclease subunit S [Candidatus Methylopumilus universalis]|uniref:restriction endonuclease subunit S n=1 Tax=Candidatus Methylopumilus universalis TaxID=2588536 RepID=UPI00112043C9|nr:restriction endonuclease subunit S [Candidatus Methylopumilus universalis]QDC90065.1 restriction endonuclease subunit S [Candidatus Methylopumilus universalis]
MKQFKLTEVADLVADRTPAFTGLKKFASTGAVDDAEIFSCEEVTYENRPSRADLITKVDDICFARMQGTLKVFIINQTNCEYLFSTGFAILRPNKSLIFPRYLFHLIKSIEFQIKKDSLCTGATQKAITNDKLKTIEIILPSIQDQKKIALILDKSSEIIVKRKLTITKLDELVQSIFADMFGDLSGNSKNWPDKLLGDVLDQITYGLTVRPKYIENGIPLVSAREIKDGYVNLQNAPRISIADFNNLSNKSKAKVGDILFSKTGSIGHSALVGSIEEFAISQNAARLSFDKKTVNNVYALYYLRSKGIQDLAKRSAIGNAVKDLQLGVMKRFPFPLPPMDLQILFAKKIIKLNFIKEKSVQDFSKHSHLIASLQNQAFATKLAT